METQCDTALTEGGEMMIQVDLNDQEGKIMYPRKTCSSTTPSPGYVAPVVMAPPVEIMLDVLNEIMEDPDNLLSALEKMNDYIAPIIQNPSDEDIRKIRLPGAYGRHARAMANTPSVRFFQALGFDLIEGGLYLKKDKVDLDLLQFTLDSVNRRITRMKNAMPLS
eukprot:TRINITY_DN5606_c0_g1::TRINITY_DN5606_c0_g1_i1::g.12023::m.12023 TRINITY_DN5606_c0_g1::TRINITY_DN5606_c0_g1_i1::g.12023  ORF type:complete len:165 (+),score=24.79,PUB/PF09409.5/2.1e+02,PUB/PF09409.5/8.1e-06,FR47/PF08445.5/0.26 TRINITY_DN5606_c0_g1_i1:94-588(+)